MSAKEGFFSRAQVYPVIWSVIGGCALSVLGFFFGRQWESRDPPEQVVVTNTRDFQAQPATTVVTATAQLDKESLAELRQTSKELRKLIELQKDNSRLGDVATTAEMQALRKKIAELEARSSDANLRGAATASVIAHAAPMPPANMRVLDDAPPPPPVRLSTSGGGDTEDAMFELPAAAKGYAIAGSPRWLSGMRCPLFGTVSQPSDVALRFSVTEAAAPKLSPLYVMVDKVKSPLELSAVFSRFAPIAVGDNQYRLATNLPDGNYVLTVGYFLRNNLSGEYPRLYALHCSFAVSH